MNQCVFRVDATPSFCNHWPEIAIEINGTVQWQGFVTQPTTLSVEFDLFPVNHAYVRYLNKRTGPTEWDTQIDTHGNIVQDQSCQLNNFMIARSRCDFLTSDLEYHHLDGTVNSTPWGFMSQKGHFHVQFPQDVYLWIVKNRMGHLSTSKEKSSSLDYWNDYLGNPNDPVTDKLLSEIDELLKKLTQ